MNEVEHSESNSLMESQETLQLEEQFVQNSMLHSTENADPQPLAADVTEISSLTVINHITNKVKGILTMHDVLVSIELEKYRDLFEKEKIDIEMLQDLDNEEIMSMFKELGITAWGERRKIRKGIETLKTQKENDDVSKTQTHFNTIHEDTVDFVDVSKTQSHCITNSEDDLFDCELCKSAEQHKCRKCNLPVCNLRCSVQDPLSDNEQHRIHRVGDSRCYIQSSQKMKCPKCDDSFEEKGNLDRHLERNHSRFEDFSELSLASEGSLSDLFIKCSTCSSAFENEYDLARHIRITHLDSINKKRKPSGSVINLDNNKKKKEEFVCLVCDLKFSRKDSLQRHNKNKH